MEGSRVPIIAPSLRRPFSLPWTVLASVPIDSYGLGLGFLAQALPLDTRSLRWATPAAWRTAGLISISGEVKESQVRVQVSILASLSLEVAIIQVVS